MVSVILVGLAAAVSRWFGEVGRRPQAPRTAQLGGWVWAMLAVWLASALFGAWVPAWPALPLALLGWASTAGAPRRVVEIATDVLATFVFGALAVPILPLTPTLGLALLVVIAGEALRYGLPKRHVRRSAVQVAVTLAVLLAGLAVGCGVVLQNTHPSPMHALFTPSVGVMPPSDNPQRMELKTGAVAWLVPPARRLARSDTPSPTGRGALVFHGADAEGSHQKAARALRRALVAAGYTVLLVDHPGYGQSPTPALDAPVEAWDPLPTYQAALRFLGEQSGVRDIILVGHSMGCVDVLRLMAALPQTLPLSGETGDKQDDEKDGECAADSSHATVSGVVLFGGAMTESDPRHPRQAYWQRRFLTDRRLPADAIDGDTVQTIRERFHMTDTFVRRLGPNHPPVLFVRFGREFDEIRAHRDALQAAIPGRMEVWELDSTHYLSTMDYERLHLVVGDVAVARQLSNRFRSLNLSRGVTPNTPGVQPASPEPHGG